MARKDFCKLKVVVINESMDGFDGIKNKKLNKSENLHE